MLECFVKLKDFIKMLLNKPEWIAKIKPKFCMADLMEKTVTVLQV